MIGHVVVSLRGCQVSGGDFQLELRTRLCLVKPRRNSTNRDISGVNLRQIWSRYAKDTEIFVGKFFVGLAYSGIDQLVLSITPKQFAC